MLFTTNYEFFSETLMNWTESTKAKNIYPLIYSNNKPKNIYGQDTAKVFRADLKTTYSSPFLIAS